MKKWRIKRVSNEMIFLGIETAIRKSKLLMITNEYLCTRGEITG